MSYEPFFNELGSTEVHWDIARRAQLPQSSLHVFGENYLKKRFMFFLEPGPPASLRFTQLQEAFSALLGYLLNHTGGKSVNDKHRQHGSRAHRV